MKQNYSAPEIQILQFESQDIITESSLIDPDYGKRG